MSYVRFTPEEYLTIARICDDHDLGHRNQPTFRRLLVAALRSEFADLAKRIARLGRARLHVLYWHFYKRTPVVKTQPHFTTFDMRLIGEACVTVPFRVRLVRPFKFILIELFQEEWPSLAKKLACLSGHQFEQLYEQVTCGRKTD